MREIFEQYIDRRINDMTSTFIELTSGDVHRDIGGYPGRNHRMVICCDVMYKRMAGNDEVISAPPSGKGATVTIRYYQKNHQKNQHGGTLGSLVSIKKTKLEKTSSKSELRTKPNENHLLVCGYRFDFIQELIPENAGGKAVAFYPQQDYNNLKKLPLHQHGSGAFCKFRIKATSTAGVYLWVIQDAIVYIGETADFAKRFNIGYGNISPRNCFEGGQLTNCKMNKIAMKAYDAGNPVKIFFYATDKFKQVELVLLSQNKTIYNVKNN